MECSKCGGWIHAQCEGLDGEQYQVLSYLPDSVSYVCKCNIPAPKARKSSGRIRKQDDGEDDVHDVPDSAMVDVGEDGLQDVAALVPVPVQVTNSPLRDNSLHSLNHVPSLNFDLDNTFRSINLLQPLSNITVSTDPTEFSDLLDADATDVCETSPKPSEAIDDEYDDADEYVTLDTSVLALPSAFETLPANWSTTMYFQSPLYLPTLLREIMSDF